MKNQVLQLLILLALPLLISCTGTTYKSIDTGVIVELPKTDPSQASMLKVEVLEEDIIRVSAVPGNTFPDRQSLVRVLEDPPPQFQLRELEDELILSTSKLRVSISLESGELQFMDSSGKILLKEQEGGGKRFWPVSADGHSGYSFHQLFESPGDEAFFGLGQHQSDEWNYKGKNEILYQYNTKVSVPFVVSNKKYGLLWDNYSLTKFGDIRTYDNLSRFTLYDQQGKEGGLTATYTTADGEVFTTRTESKIDYENLESVQDFPADFSFWESEITWQGRIEAPESGAYEFKLYYAGYTTVIVDGKEVVPERWRTAWNPNTYKFRIRLEAGQAVPVLIRWKPDGGISYLGLKALGPLVPVEQSKLSLWSEMGQELDYYFIHGETMDSIISGYRQLTGKAPIMPEWAYGFWQSRERYKTQEEITETLAEFRRRKIPIDNIVQDWSYWEEDQWGSHEFDPRRFPDPKRMIDDIHDMNAHIMISVWPKFYHNTEHYRELNEKGWMYPRAVDDSIRDWIAQGYIGSFYDAYAEGAQKLFWEQMKEHLYDLGMDAWWMDASEPDILSNASLEYRKELSGPTALGSSTEFLNTYSLVNAKAIYKGQRNVDPNKRVFLLTRSGFAGLQRYSTATWSGDIGTRWEDMKAQISAGLNFSLSGIPHWTMDIGGFCVEHRYVRAKEGSEDLEEWRELNTRWTQFAAFAPLFRSHGQYPFREIFHIAPDHHPAYRSMLKYNKLRYRLMPYLYSLAGKVWFDDYTIMRPMVMDFPDDRKLIAISDQYMFGPSLMICPVYEYKARERKVYFPAGYGWFDLHTGRSYKGGTEETVAAPYEEMPIFVRAGSIIPFGPDIQYVGEKSGETLKLFVYEGANGEFTLYEDEGVNYNYENGACSGIPFTYEEESHTLVIGKREGSFNGMPEERNLEVYFVAKAGMEALDLDRVPDHSVHYTGGEIILNL